MRRLNMIYVYFVSKYICDMKSSKYRYAFLLTKLFTKLIEYLNITILVKKYKISGRPLKSFLRKKSRETIMWFDNLLILLICTEYILGSDHCMIFRSYKAKEIEILLSRASQINVEDLLITKSYVIIIVLVNKNK